jgi:peptidoglycan/LPS O-acetylase OafA/YrhL
MMFLKRGETLADRLEAHKGITTGFDYLRLALAISIFSLHSITLTSHVWDGPFRALAACLLPMFFALSGFLVSASLARTANLATFLAYRAIRIIPALAVEVFISALLLGPFVTELPLKEYFSDPKFRVYFLNIFGIIHYNLPGVFPHNPLPEVVNGPLWTVPYELECYIALSLLAVFGLLRSRALLFLLIVAGTLAATDWLVRTCPPDCYYRPLGKTLVLCFLAGVLFYQCREWIRLNSQIFLACVGLALVFLSIGPLLNFAILPLTYTTVYLGLLNPPKRSFLLRGDYSYGIYLFGYPMQQLCISFAPDVRNSLLNFACAFPLALACAWASWNFVEGPILRRKKRIAGFLGLD